MRHIVARAVENPCLICTAVKLPCVAPKLSCSGYLRAVIGTERQRPSETPLTSTFTDCGTVLERATMAGMTHRLHRSPRGLSVTSLGVRGLLTSGFTLAGLALVPPNTANADPTVRCRTLEGGGDYVCVTETPTAPATTGSTGTSSGAGLGDWFSEHAGAFVFVIAVAAVVAIVAMVKSGTSKDKAAEAAVAHARGHQIAQDAGVEPAAQAPEDLRRYGAFGWAVPHVPGTAFGNLVDRDGGTSRIYAAWTQACELARLGHWTEDGVFIPAAVVVNVNGYHDGSGDLELSVNTADYTVGETQLNRVLEHLVRTARVETASAFSRDAVRDWHITRLSMTPAAQQAAAPEQEASAPDPTTAWEW